MAHPVIIRTQKLSSIASVKRSGSHTWRERKTPNAIPERTPLNTDLRGVRGSAALAEAVAARVALATEKATEKPVVAIEYLITARHEAFKENGGTVDADAYFRDAMAWLEARHGKENIVAANIQRDERSPHLVAYVVPLVQTEAKTRKRSVIVGTNPDGTKRRETREYAQPATVRLSASHFQGKLAQLSLLQTDFAEQVGKRHGLKRGVKGSRAEHQTVRTWYGKLDLVANDPRLKPVKLVPVPDEPGALTWGEKRRVAEQARAEALEHNRKAREHNAERAKLMQALAGHGLAHVSEQQRAAQAIDAGKAAEREAAEMRALARSKVNHANQLVEQLDSAKATIRQQEQQLGDLKEKLELAESRAEVLMKDTLELRRELRQHAPERARELGMALAQPQRRSSGPRI
jgi:hypothetical protein